jgi:hypothetical protein
MSSLEHVQIGEDLTVIIGNSRAVLSPTEGLALSEELARKSFRRALAEEAFAFDRLGATAPGLAA